MLIKCYILLTILQWYNLLFNKFPRLLKETFNHFAGIFEVGALLSFHFHLRLIQLSG